MVTRVDSRLWMKSLVSSAGILGISQISVPRVIWPSSATTTTRSEPSVRDKEGEEESVARKFIQNLTRILIANYSPVSSDRGHFILTVTAMIITKVLNVKLIRM